jgi:hypothetical protein
MFFMGVLNHLMPMMSPHNGLLLMLLVLRRVRWLDMDVLNVLQTIPATLVCTPNQAHVLSGQEP